jgi:hypothetical protein
VQTASLFDEPTQPAEEPKGETPEARAERIKIMQEFSIERCDAAKKLIDLGNELYACVTGKPWQLRRPGGRWEFMTDGEMLSLARRLT